jgi:hypothetical protein
LKREPDRPTSWLRRIHQHHAHRIRSLHLTTGREKTDIPLCSVLTFWLCAYGRRHTVTQERTLPALEAAHTRRAIKRLAETRCHPAFQITAIIGMTQTDQLPIAGKLTW